MNTRLIALLLLTAGCGKNNKNDFVGVWDNGSDYLVINRANADNFTLKMSPMKLPFYSSSEDAVGHCDAGCECLEVRFRLAPLKVVLTKKGVFVDRLGEFKKYGVVWGGLIEQERTKR